MVETIKDLREKSGCGIMECRSALMEAKGDIPKAVELLHQRGLVKAEKKTTRTASQGLVEAYVHQGGRIGTMLELNCETDFVARTQEFKELIHNLALQVAAQNPKFISVEQLPKDSTLDPKEACLLAQPFIKDPAVTIEDLIKGVIARVGENIKVRRFIRYELDEE